jgi:hypothetical protein
MYRVARAALLVLVCVFSLGAQTLRSENGTATESDRAQPLPTENGTATESYGIQTVPAGKRPATRWILDTETGSEAGLGFKMPHIATGISFERPVTRHFELQGLVSCSPDRKYITNDGNSLRLMSTGLYWISPNLALTGSLRHSNLWTSQFNKSSWGPSGGIAIREDLTGYPGRIYLDYLMPTGCQWGPSCPIQSSRTQGAEIYWESLMASHLRVGFRFGFNHFLEQSNQFRPDIPRTGHMTGISLIVLRYDFGRMSLDEAY